MADSPHLRVLTINSGSSSLKLAKYRMGQTEDLVISGKADRIGLEGSSFHLADGSGNTLVDEQTDLPGHEAALERFFDWMRRDGRGRGLDAVGHRVVHGGRDYSGPHLVNTELMSSLDKLVALAPDHLPQEIKAIRAVTQFAPDISQVACFDTAFHRGMPKIAQLFPLPRHIINRGVIRYGFHGLSYEYILMQLRKEAGSRTAEGRIVIAHLGNGASMAAVRGGRGIDTTMGFTPAGGLMMSSRSGDLDPGVVLHLLKEKGSSPSKVNDLINKEAGLAGVSGISSDMKDLLSKAADVPDAAEAVQLFCYQAKKYLGALAAVLGGVDTLIFTAGIGENSPEVRRRICDGMEYLGISLDEKMNTANEAIISGEGAAVIVRVMKTDEELMIARHTRDVIIGRASSGSNPGYS